MTPATGQNLEVRKILAVRPPRGLQGGAPQTIDSVGCRTSDRVSAPSRGSYGKASIFVGLLALLSGRWFR
jgi:hypothetical protein